MIEIRNLFHVGGSPADLRYKEEERKRPGEIAEKTAREECTLDWSQSKVFLVLLLHRVIILHCDRDCEQSPQVLSLLHCIDALYHCISISDLFQFVCHVYATVRGYFNKSMDLT